MKAKLPFAHAARAGPPPREPPPRADNFLPNGRQGIIKKFKYILSYQPRWDMYGRMLQHLSSGTPVMTSTGNHELEFQPDGTVFAAYNTRCVRARQPPPQQAPRAPGPQQGPPPHVLAHNQHRAAPPLPP